MGVEHIENVVEDELANDWVRGGFSSTPQLAFPVRRAEVERIASAGSLLYGGNRTGHRLTTISADEQAGENVGVFALATLTE